jgi:hypothetical protein
VELDHSESLPKFTDSDYRDFVKRVQEMALAAYPNPERVGCPNADVLHEIAVQDWPTEHRLFQGHIVRCSPCMAVVLEERTRFQAERQKKRRRLLVAAAAVGMAASLMLVSLPWLRRQLGPSGSTQFETLSWDLKPFSALRSAAQPPSPPPLSARATGVKATLSLPIGLPEGPYDIRILTTQLELLRREQASAVFTNGAITISIAIDLRGIKPGRYTLALRPVAEGEEWRTYPLMVKPVL